MIYLSNEIGQSFLNVLSSLLKYSDNKAHYVTNSSRLLVQTSTLEGVKSLNANIL